MRVKAGTPPELSRSGSTTRSSTWDPQPRPRVKVGRKGIRKGREEPQNWMRRAQWSTTRKTRLWNMPRENLGIYIYIQSQEHCADRAQIAAAAQVKIPFADPADITDEALAEIAAAAPVEIAAAALAEITAPPAEIAAAPDVLGAAPATAFLSV